MKIILGLKFIYTHVVVEAVPSSISSAWYTFLTDVKGRAAKQPPHPPRLPFSPQQEGVRVVVIKIIEFNSICGSSSLFF